jgi:hypothetical protein
MLIATMMRATLGSAMPCKRAARFGVSPTIARSWEAPEPIRSPTTTSPVAMPTRACRGLQATHCSDQLQPCAHSPLRVALVSLRVAKVDEDPISHVLRHKAPKAPYDHRNALLAGRDNLTQVFRVHARRERR